MRKRWKNRTLIGYGHVAEDLLDSFRGSAGDEMGEGTNGRLSTCLSNTVPRLLHECVASEGTAR
jgi:hypothetical protein